MSSIPEPIVFTYPESVFGRRLEGYLNLRNIPYTPVRVPPKLPRPLLNEKLGINHRRIPLLALGRDIYIDTRLIIKKLEDLFPDSPNHPALGAKDDFGKGFEEMLELWVIDGGPFYRTSGCIPLHAPLMQDPAWVKDRQDGSGGAFTVESLRANRAWCLSQLRIFFGIMECMLKDGREWVLGNSELPGLADVHGCWVYDWGLNMASDMFAEGEREAETSDIRKALSEREFPYVHAWVARFRDICAQARTRNPRAMPTAEGADAEGEIVRAIFSSGFAEPQYLSFDEEDVLGFKHSQRVSIAPSDFGFAHPDEGLLVGLSTNEATIQMTNGNEQQYLRLHYPRINFKITPVSDQS